MSARSTKLRPDDVVAPCKLPPHGRHRGWPVVELLAARVRLAVKVFVHGPDLRGRYQLPDPVVDTLAERHRSAKRSYFEVDFDQEQRRRAAGFLVTAEAAFDWMLEDTDILERNLYTDPAHTDLVQRALAVLERERMLNQEPFEPDDAQFLRGLNLATLKPGAIVEGTPVDDQLQGLIRALHNALGRIFFYTAGKSEARVWEVAAHAGIVTAAGQVHSDLERGFIRAEVYNCADLKRFRTPQEARSKGLLRIVDRSYRIAAGDVIDVKFNV